MSVENGEIYNPKHEQLRFGKILQCRPTEAAVLSNIHMANKSFANRSVQSTNKNALGKYFNVVLPRLLWCQTLTESFALMIVSERLRHNIGNRTKSIPFFRNGGAR